MRRGIYTQAAILLAMAACLSPRPCAAQSLVIGDFSGGLEGGAPAGWQLARHAGTPELCIAPGPDGEPALSMRSDRASFGVQRALAVDLKAYPVLRWKWRVDELPRGGDFRSGGTDDQAAQLYVAFPRMRVIAYFWEAEPPEGTIGDLLGIPPFAKVRVIVLRSGPKEAGRWVGESRDLQADYRTVFGEELRDERALGIRIWTNSQHTLSCSDCSFSKISFCGRP